MQGQGILLCYETSFKIPSPTESYPPSSMPEQNISHLDGNKRPTCSFK